MTLGEDLKFRKLNAVRKAILQEHCSRIEGVVDANIYEAIVEELDKYVRSGIILKYYFCERWGSFYIEYPT